MGKNSSDILVETMLQWGIDTIFGIPGDGINGVFEALRQRQDRIRFIQTRHEEAAAFMACGYAKYTKRLGCCIATSGPGGIHLLNGLYDAKMDQAPVLAITGQTYSDLQGTRFQQDLNLCTVFEDVACYNQQLMNPSQMETLANEACRYALSHRGVAHLNLPVDYQMKEPEGVSKHRHGHDTGSVWAPQRAIPEPEQLARAAEILNSAKRPAILIGQGALGAAHEVVALASKIGAPVSKALLGKAAIPDTHPLSMGGLGLLGTSQSQTAMEHCDVLLMIGTSFPYMDFLPKPGQAKGIQIDDKADRMGLRFPIDLPLIGDAKLCLQQLLPLIDQNEDREWLEGLQRVAASWKKSLEEQARHEFPIRPQQIGFELNTLLDDDAIVSTDSGTNTTWAARYLDMRGDMMFSCSGTLATMACGLPYAIAARIAFPERQSVAFVGDGGFTMLMGEFATACKYNLPIVAIIVKNNTLGQIKWEQIVFLGNPEYGVDLHPINFAKFAEACGGLGISVEKPEDLRPAIERALASGRPAVVEVAVNPFEPPMPAKVTLQQAEHFAEALLKGEPNGPQIGLTIFRDKIAELL
ncbi:MAG TPA: thiamine pyrophosphate-dependent enzyme [Fimbriimonas sp.]|nr:thiamine pyrophosphate-dependent enzyme [Fimbriimonas sp.]